MEVNVFPSFMVFIISSLCWTRIEMKYYHDMDNDAYLAMTYECPKECFCPSSFPHALYCDNKRLKEVPSIPSRIWYLYLQNNQIDTLSGKAFANATELKWINLNKNNLTDEGIEKGLLMSLNKLLYLFVEDNNLEAVPDPLPESLEQLRLARNKLSKIPEGVFSNLENLTMLDLQHNKLADSAFQSDTFKGLRNLMQLNVAKNALKKMPLSLPSNTMQLFLDNNLIESIPKNYFNAIPKVAFIRLNYNKLSDVGIPENVFNISSLLDLQLSYNQLTAVPPISARLEHLHLAHNKIMSVNGSIICPAPIDLESLKDPYSGSGPRLRYLRLDGNDIKPPIPIDLLMCFRLLHAIII